MNLCDYLKPLSTQLASLYTLLHTRISHSMHPCRKFSSRSVILPHNF
eukprot:COSAG03_NODE_18019_length_363_cov_1.284091_1_plen_46_part_01